ncbi:thioesterase family protein [Melaminivora sp.]|uniref:acyl-CoA thioesterase n=1 Tax=Melaminivora sp. TaxID=1933032 RepID=UPI0028B1A395|nr:thioesterase family protein [Melaminivora sp.]
MKIAIPEDKKLVHQMELDVRWGDMDAMGHVNNAVYFRYMETLRVDWFGVIGATPDPSGQGPVIANAFCNFYRQLEYPARLMLRMYVSEPARTTFETWTTIERLDRPGEIAAAGGATVIWVDFPRQKATELPQRVRELVG